MWEVAANWDTLAVPTEGSGAVIESPSLSKSASAVVSQRIARASRLLVSTSSGSDGASVTIEQRGKLVVKGSVTHILTCPTPSPTEVPLPLPTVTPTPGPSVSSWPTPLPTVPPTVAPTTVPTPHVTDIPTYAPTEYETPCNGVRPNVTRVVLDQGATDVGFECLSWNEPKSWDNFGEIPRIGDEVVLDSELEPEVRCMAVSSSHPEGEVSRVVVSSANSDLARVLVVGKCL